MGFSMWHVSDRELLLAADRELTPARERRLRRHLSACPDCTARADGIQQDPFGTLADAGSGAAAPLPPAAPARARLRMRLAAVAREDATPGAVAWGRAAACALLAVVAGLAWTMVRPGQPVPDAPTMAGGVLLLPRGDLTPGLALPVAAADLCGAERVVARPVAHAVQRDVFDRYGADFARAREYELDHLITPELGGASDARNLWPQPFGRTIWNAYVKDELELHLHQLVCEGTLDLASAQRELAVDWIAAYKQRFQTERPRRDYAASPLTGADAEFVRAELAELGVEPPAGTIDGAGLLSLLQTSRQGWR